MIERAGPAQPEPGAKPVAVPKPGPARAEASGSAENEADRQPPPQGQGQRRLLVVLVVIAGFATLYFAQAIFIPLVAALLVNLLFKPVVRRLAGWHVSPPITSVLIVVVLFVVMVVGAYLLSGPIARWVEDAPQNLALIEARLRPLQAPIRGVTEATQSLEAAASVGADDGQPVQAVQVEPQGFASMILSTTGATLTGLLLTLVLAFFLLASDDLFLLKTVRLMPNLRTKREAVETAHQLEADVSRYLLTVTLINLCLGLVLWVGFALAGLPNALLWAGLAAVMNYIPYIGPMVAFVLLAAGSLLSFETLGQASVAPLIFAGTTALEGYVITPTIMGRRMRLNPVAVLLSLMLWGWLWGVAGALLAVPILVCFKILCDRVEALSAVGAFLSDE